MSIITVFEDRNRLERENREIREQLTAQQRGTSPLEVGIKVQILANEEKLGLELLIRRQEETIQRLREQNKQLSEALENQVKYATGCLQGLQAWQEAAMGYWPPAWAFNASNPQTVLASLMHMARLDGVKAKHGKGAANFLYAVQFNLQARMHQIRGLQERLRNVRREYRRDRARLEAQISQLETVITDQARTEAKNGLD